MDLDQRLNGHLRHWPLKKTLVIPQLYPEDDIHELQFLVVQFRAISLQVTPLTSCTPMQGTRYSSSAQGQVQMRAFLQPSSWQ